MIITNRKFRVISAITIIGFVASLIVAPAATANSKETLTTNSVSVQNGNSFDIWDLTGSVGNANTREITDPVELERVCAVDTTTVGAPVWPTASGDIKYYGVTAHDTSTAPSGFTFTFDPITKKATGTVNDTNTVGTFDIDFKKYKTDQRVKVSSVGPSSTSGSHDEYTYTYVHHCYITHWTVEVTAPPAPEEYVIDYNCESTDTNTALVPPGFYSCPGETGPKLKSDTETALIDLDAESPVCGWAFDGWSLDDPSVIEIPVLIESDTFTYTDTSVSTVVLYAIWHKTGSWVISWDPNHDGLPISETTTVNIGESTTVNDGIMIISHGEGTRDNYSFSGWTEYESDVLLTDYFPTACTTLYGNWTLLVPAKTITVHYDANGGSGEPEDETTTVNTPYNPQAGPTGRKPVTGKTCTFFGWGLASDSTTAISAESLTAGFAVDTTLWAIWNCATNPPPPPGPSPAPTEYTLTFITGGGCPVGPRSSATFTLPKTFGAFSGLGDCDEYEFLGWDIPGPVSPTGNLTVTAQWKKKEAAPVPGPTLLSLNASVDEKIGKKKLVVNQIVPIAQVVTIDMPTGYTLKKVLINGKEVTVKILADGQVELTSLFGPKDKISAVVRDAAGKEVSVPLSIEPIPVDLANVNFNLAKSYLTAEAKKILDKVVATVVAHGFTSIDLTGHTDSRGKGSFDNQKLSEARSNNVLKYLAKALSVYGITINKAAVAEADPVASNKKSGQVLNRRVDIRVNP